VAPAQLFAKFDQRSAMGFRFHLRSSRLLISVGDPGGAAVAVVERHHARDAMQLDRCGQSVICYDRNAFGGNMEWHCDRRPTQLFVV
jgi:hypothetical protein